MNLKLVYVESDSEKLEGYGRVLCFLCDNRTPRSEKTEVRVTRPVVIQDLAEYFW